MAKALILMSNVIKSSCLMLILHHEMGFTFIHTFRFNNILLEGFLFPLRYTEMCLRNNKNKHKFYCAEHFIFVQMWNLNHLRGSVRLL